MSRTAEELMTHPAIACRRSDSAGHVAKLMSKHECGCVFVVDPEGRLVGAITDRDICLAALEHRAPLALLSAANTMSPIVLSCRPTDGLDTVMQLMQHRRVRRLPVVDLAGMLLGVISLSDLAREAALDARESDFGITNADVGLTLATICWGPLGERAADVLGDEAVSSWQSEGNPNVSPRHWEADQHRRLRMAGR